MPQPGASGFARLSRTHEGVLQFNCHTHGCCQHDGLVQCTLHGDYLHSGRPSHHKTTTPHTYTAVTMKAQGTSPVSAVLLISARLEPPEHTSPQLQLLLLADGL